MYIDLIVLIILIIVVLMFFKRFSSFVFLMAIVEITLRILTFIKDNIGVKDIRNIISKYLPENMFAMINRYTENGSLFNIIISRIYILLLAYFISQFEINPAS